MENPYEAPHADSAPVPLEPVSARQPASVIVFGVLNVVFGLLGVVCAPLSVITMLMPRVTGAQPNPVLNLMKGEAYRGVTIGSAVIGWVAAAVLLASGIGLLKERRWARKLSIGYAMYSIVAGLLGMAFNAVFVARPVMEAARQDNSPEMASAVAIAVISVVGGVVGLIFPVALLVFMTRPRVVAYLERSRP